LEQLIDLQDSIGIAAEKIDIPFVLLNFFISVLVSFLIKKFYMRYSSSLTGKNHIGTIIPILSSVIFLVIIIVKSSLALSLGLVGALSIVRFRTPIKEPEELVYLFLAISVGLGYGAGYPLITTIIILLTLIIIYFFLFNKKGVLNNEYNLIINNEKENLNYDQILNTLANNCETIKLIRIDSSNNTNTIVFSLSLKEESNIKLILDDLKSIGEADVSFFEARTNW